MVNLVVAIISVGLAVVLTVMTTFYLGTYFISSQANANANKYINYMNQVAGALDVWSQQNGGVLPRPNSSFPSACGNTAYCTATELRTILTSRYITLPNTPDGADTTQFFYWNEASSLMQNPVLLLRLNSGAVALPTCRTVETLRQGGSVPAALRVYGGGVVNINRYMCSNFGCFQNDGTFGSAATYPYIVYARLRGAPSTSLSDSTGPICPTS